MHDRLGLHEKLCEILGSRNVYFQPPSSVLMRYPAIVYELDNIRNRHADDGIYAQSLKYSLTVIDYDPDSKIVEKVAKLPKCSFSRHFTSDNLNHDVFTIFY